MIIFSCSCMTITKPCFCFFIKGPFGSAVVPAFRPNLNFFFFFAKIEFGLYFLDRFDVLMSKMIFKNWKNVIDMYFGTKSYLKSNRYHITKHALKLTLQNMVSLLKKKNNSSNKKKICFYRNIKKTLIVGWIFN